MTTPVRALADRVFAYRVAGDWYLQLRKGIPVEHLRVEGFESLAADARHAESVLDELSRITPENEDDRLTVGFLEHAMAQQVEAERTKLLRFGVTPYQTYPIAMTLSMVVAPFQGTGSAYRQLVADLVEQVRTVDRELGHRREAGLLLSAAAVPGSRESLARLRAGMAAVVPASAPSDVADAVAAQVEAELLPAVDGLIASLGEDYERDAPREVGLAQYPGGIEAYETTVRQYTASTLTPKELHELGLQQVAELAEKMAEARSAMGFRGTEQEFKAQLAVDPRVHASSPEEVEALFLRHMAALEPLISQWFSVLPEAPYGVARLDPEQEAGVTFGYYEPPTASQPVGRYRWNGADLESKSLLSYAALIFHELAPGHHFHLARQGENAALPDLRREGGEISAFNEGWAEYASGLGWEMGLYDDPLDAYGRLAHERFTAQRLVVDTGLNAFGWSLDQAADYMRANTTETDAQIASEVRRYATDIPGQALAYRAGFIELNRLRAKAEAAFGADFDVRAFHERVLSPGALPFPTIDAHLDRWIAGEISGS